MGIQGGYGRGVLPGYYPATASPPPDSDRRERAPHRGVVRKQVGAPTVFGGGDGPRYPPTPDPCRVFRGPLRWYLAPCGYVLGGWVVPRYSPPIYPPSPHTHPGTPLSPQCSLHVHSARYSRF